MYAFSFSMDGKCTLFGGKQFYFLQLDIYLVQQRQKKAKDKCSGLLHWSGHAGVTCCPHSNPAGGGGAIQDRAMQHYAFYRSTKATSLWLLFFPWPLLQRNDNYTIAGYPSILLQSLWLSWCLKSHSFHLQNIKMFSFISFGMEY